MVELTGHAHQAGLRAILLARDAAIYKLLRSSENVAHTKWLQRGADRLTQEYVRGPAKVKYVLGIVPALVQALLSPDDEGDWWTLADLFPDASASPLADRPVVPSDDGATGTIQHDDLPTEDDDDEVVVPPLEPKVRQWLARPTPDGLRLEANPAFQKPLRPMEFIAAYGLLNRTGFRSHNSADFSFMETPSMILANNASVSVLNHNRLGITPNGNDFSVEIKGFDHRRSLDYRVAIAAHAGAEKEDDD